MYCIVFIRRNITFSGIHNLEKTIVNVPRVQNYGKKINTTGNFTENHKKLKRDEKIRPK